MDCCMGRQDQAVKAAIDIGSNTVLLLVGYVKGRSVISLYEQHHAPRLGKGVDVDKNLSVEAMNNVISIVASYRNEVGARYPALKEVIVTATSAVRDAKNKQLFIQQVKQETGFDVKILNGKEEARYTFFGALAALDNPPVGSAAVIDIGGGSTEVALGNLQGLKDRHSYDVGSVRFTERYFKNGTPAHKEIALCRENIRKVFNECTLSYPSRFRLVAVAGTATSLAHIHFGLHTYQPEKINGQLITREEVSGVISRIKDKTPSQLLEAYTEILKGRADVILSGMIILETFMISNRISEVLISVGGLRHGAIIL